MNPGNVQVFFISSKDKKVHCSTHHAAADAKRVSDSLVAAGVGREFVEERTNWSAKMREAYVKELRRRGLLVMLRGDESFS